MINDEIRLSPWVWIMLYRLISDLPTVVKLVRSRRGLSRETAAEQMIGITPYKLKKFEDGQEVSMSDLRSILLWMASYTETLPYQTNERGESPNHPGRFK